MHSRTRSVIKSRLLPKHRTSYSDISLKQPEVLLKQLIGQLNVKPVQSRPVTTSSTYLFGSLQSKKPTRGFINTLKKQLQFLGVPTDKANPRKRTPDKKFPGMKLHPAPLFAKQALFFDVLDTVNMSNGVQVVDDPKTYKFYIGKGNNSELIKRVMRTRRWWVATESYTEAHFVWTSARPKPLLRMLGTAESPSIEDLPFATTSQYGFDLISERPVYCTRSLSTLSATNLKICNRLIKNTQLSNKKNLFKNLKAYFQNNEQKLFEMVPVTYHIQRGLEDPKFANIWQSPNEGPWIVKPGEHSNRGSGIFICETKSQLKEFFQNPIQNISKYQTVSKRSFIIQEYIKNPLLIYGRKFDIRCFVLVTCINGVMQGYFYHEGYIRTSSQQFSLSNFEDKFIHLTNDAIQSQSTSYGKHEPSNKLSFAEFRSYLATHNPSISWDQDIIEQLRRLVTDTLAATMGLLDPDRHTHCFELFGLDFMLDASAKLWLIEVNTNPCLEQQCFYLSSLLPRLLDNAFRLTLDPLLRPSRRTSHWQTTSFSLENKFELVFTS